MSIQPPHSDTSILEVSELQRAEEELEAQEDDGVKLEAFNLKEERARGHFDEAGNYVQDVKGSDEEEEEDAWLKSEEGGSGRVESGGRWGNRCSDWDPAAVIPARREPGYDPPCCIHHVLLPATLPLPDELPTHSQPRWCPRRSVVG